MRYPILILLAVAVVSPAASPENRAPKFDGLGEHSRKVSANAEAQTYFDQGLAFLFAFNHDEAIRSFEQAAELDPDCAMAHWGVAITNGGHINKPSVEPQRAKKALAADTVIGSSCLCEPGAKR